MHVGLPPVPLHPLLPLQLPRADGVDHGEHCPVTQLPVGGRTNSSKRDNVFRYISVISQQIYEQPQQPPAGLGLTPTITSRHRPPHDELPGGHIPSVKIRNTSNTRMISPAPARHRSLSRDGKPLPTLHMQPKQAHKSASSGPNLLGAQASCTPCLSGRRSANSDHTGLGFDERLRTFPAAMLCAVSQTASLDIGSTEVT